MHNNNVSIEEIMRITKLQQEEIMDTINKNDNKKTTKHVETNNSTFSSITLTGFVKSFSVENEIIEMKKDIKDLKKDMKELIAIMNAVYEFTDA